MGCSKGLIFRCDICGETAPARLGTFLPRGWSGRGTEGGFCICASCRQAIEKTKKEVGGARKNGQP